MEVNMVRSRWAIVLLVAAFGIAALLVLPGRYSFATSNGCVPTPHEPERIGTATITPDARLTATPGPSPVSLGVTPIPYAEIIDLAPDIPDRDKAQVIVFRCDGRFALYWVPGSTALVIPELGPGDVIFNSFSPESLVGQHIHITTDTPETPRPTEVTITPFGWVPSPYPTLTPWDYPIETPTASQTPWPYDS